MENHHEQLQTFGASLFKPIGYTASSFNYAHLSFEVNFTDVELRFGLIEQLQDRLTDHWMASTEDALRQKLSHLIRTTSQEKQFIVEEWKNVRTLFSSTNVGTRTDQTLESDSTTGRKKRFAIGLGAFAVTTLFGLFSGYELNNLVNRGSRNEYLVQRMDDQEDNLLMFVHHMEILNKTVHQVLSLSQRNSALIKFSTYRSYLSSVIHLETNQVGKLVLGLEALLEHRLSPKLLHHNVLAEALNRLDDKANQEGFKLAIGLVTDVFQCETSFQLSEDGNVLRIFVHVPIYRPASVLRLYQYIETPQLTNDSVHAFSMASDQDVIAVSENDELYFGTRLVELNECQKLHQWKFCEMTSVMQTYFNSSCISSLYAGLAEDCNRLCQFKQLPAKPSVTPIGKATFVVYHPQEQTITMACGSEIVQNMFTGIRRIVLKPGCRAISDSQQLVYDKSLRLDIEVKVQPLNFTVIEAGHLLGYLNQMDKVDVPRVIDPIMIQRTRLRFVPLWVSTGLTLLIIGIVCLVFFRFKRRVKANIRRVVQAFEPVTGFLKETTPAPEEIPMGNLSSSDAPGGRLVGTGSTPGQHLGSFNSVQVTHHPPSTGVEVGAITHLEDPNAAHNVLIHNDDDTVV